MKFFLDENLPWSLAKNITALGFQAEHVRMVGLRGAEDKEIAAYAKKHQAVLITKDKEFGSFLFYPPGSHYGLLLLRLPASFTSLKIKQAVVGFLQKVNPNELEHSIIVLEVGKYRRRVW